jgi:hypothetical protein
MFDDIVTRQLCAENAWRVVEALLLRAPVFAMRLAEVR